MRYRLIMTLEGCLQSLQRARELCPSGHRNVRNGHPETHFFGLVLDECEWVMQLLHETGKVDTRFKDKAPEDDEASSFELALPHIQTAQRYVESAIKEAGKIDPPHGYVIAHLLTEAISRAYAVLDAMLPVIRVRNADEREHPKVGLTMDRADVEELLKRDDLSERVREAIKDSL